MLLYLIQRRSFVYHVQFLVIWNKNKNSKRIFFRHLYLKISYYVILTKSYFAGFLMWKVSFNAASAMFCYWSTGAMDIVKVLHQKRVIHSFIFFLNYYICSYLLFAFIVSVIELWYAHVFFHCFLLYLTNNLFFINIYGISL